MKQNRNETQVGIFVVVGFIVLALIVFFISGVYLFRPGYSVSIMYDYVDILDKGAPVRMAGVRVGEVSAVSLLFDETKQHTRVKVKLFIAKGTEIRENYDFTIRGTHILSEPHIEITPKAGNAPILQDGKILEGVSLAPIEALIDRAHHIMDSLDSVLSGVSGAVNGKEGASSVKELIENLSSISKSLSTVLNGSENDLKGTLKNLNTSTEALDRILTKVDQGEGTVGALLKKDEIYQDMKSLMSDIKAHPWKLLKKK